MSKYDRMDIYHLGNLLSDYHIFVHGFKPQDKDLYSDRARMIEMLIDLEARIDRRDDK